MRQIDKSVIRVFLACAIGVAAVLPLLAGEAAVETQRGMVVCVSPPAADAGADILRQGGTAVDAAVAVGFAMAVTWPEAGNIGGGGFMMVYPGRRQSPICIEYRETAPAAATETMLAGETGMTGHRVVGTPGTVAGLALAHQKFGRKPWRALVGPAVALARDGFPVDAALAKSLNETLKEVRKKTPHLTEFLRVYGPPNGQDAWRPGDRLVQPELAKTLELIAEHGPEGFYRGPVADLIEAEMRAGGGILTKQDLAGYEARVREPIHGTYRGYDIYTTPPPSGGGICLIEMLNILECFELAEGMSNNDMGQPPSAVQKDGAQPPSAVLGDSTQPGAAVLHDRPSGRVDSVSPWPARTMHLMIEEMRRAYCDRARYAGDPDFVSIPAHLTSKEHARRLAATIDPNRATPSETLAPDIPLAPESPDTTHFSIVDADGMAVSNTYTLENNFGSRVVVRGGGFLLNNEMTDFNRNPGRTDRKGGVGTPANRIAPGKRMLSSQTPTLVCRDGRLVLVTGSPGSRTITNTVLCIIVGMVDFQRDVQRAVDAPRFHHQWFPDLVRFEGMKQPEYQAAIERLEALGHRFDRDEKHQRQGDAHSIRIDPATGRRIGAADKRIDGKVSVENAVEFR